MAASSRALFLAACLAFVALSAQAGEVLVGGKPDAWKLGSDSLTKWAQNARFRIGDSLVWKQDGSKDSVLQVSQVDYTNCNTTSPIEEYSYNKEGGDIKVKLERSGPFFFISGVKGQCDKGQKLRIVVVSPRHASFLAPSPAPAGGVDGPAVAPTSGAARTGAAALAVAFGAILAFVI